MDEETGLTQQEYKILTFENQWWKQPGAKARAITEKLGLSEIRYYQILNELIDRPEALEYDPTLINRLRRLRNTRRQ